MPIKPSRLYPALITFALLGLGIYLLRDSFHELSAILAKTRILPLFCSLLAFVAATAVLSQRLRCVFAAVEIRSRFLDFFYYLLVATFSSNFFRLPGGAALVTAVVAAADLKASFHVCLVASVADRLIGMLTVPILASLGLWWAVADSDTMWRANVLAIFSSVAMVIPVVFAILVPKQSPVRRNILAWLRRIHLDRIAKALVVLVQSPKMLITTALLTAVVFFFYSLSAYFVAVALGFEVPFSAFLVLTPALAIAMLVFPSMGGWGVRETVFAILLKPYLSLEEAVGVSILFYGINLITSLLSGVFIAFKGWPKMKWPKGQSVSGD